LNPLVLQSEVNPKLLILTAFVQVYLFQSSS
jgi:hypothetical protein